MMPKLESPVARALSPNWNPNRPDLFLFYKDVSDSVATISKLWKIIETPARLSENKCGTLIRAYYKVLEHCGHKLREFSEEVIRPQIGTIANEVHAICGDCVSFLTDRATNFGDGVIGENIVRYWENIAEVRNLAWDSLKYFPESVGVAEYNRDEASFAYGKACDWADQVLPSDSLTRLSLHCAYAGFMRSAFHNLEALVASYDRVEKAIKDASAGGVVPSSMKKRLGKLRRKQIKWRPPAPRSPSHDVWAHVRRVRQNHARE